MKKKTIIVMAVAVLFTAGFGAARASALTAADIDALCAVLGCSASQRSAASALVSGTTTPTIPAVTQPATTSAYYQFSRNLYVGVSGDDVYQLQVFLNKSTDTRVAATGAGSPGNETNYYGPATAAAVRSFQATHGISTTGTVGPLTRAALNGVVTIDGSIPVTPTDTGDTHALSVTTGAPSALSATTATLNGLVSTGTLGYYKTTSVFFKYGAGSTNTLPYTSAVTLPASTMASWSSTLTGLAASTTYSYQACAVNALGTACGGVYAFTTLSSSGTTSTGTNTSSYACSNNIDDDYDGYIDYPSDPGCYGPTDNDEYNATSTNTTGSSTGLPVASYLSFGTATATTQPITFPYNGSGSPTTLWLMYGTNPSNLTQASATIGGASGAGTYTFTLSGLTAATTYYVQGYLSNTAGQTTTTVATFTTAPSAPSAVTVSGALGTAYDNIRATVLYNGGGATGTAWVKYGTSPSALTQTSTTATTVSGSGSVTITLTGTGPGTYYMQAYVQNSAGTTTSSVVTFFNIVPV